MNSSSFSVELHIKILNDLTLEEVENYGLVCRNFHEAAKALPFWKGLALKHGIELGSEVQEIKRVVRDYLIHKKLVITSFDELKKKVCQLFENLEENETRAFRYYSHSSKDKYGILFRCLGKDIVTVFDNIPKRLTIVGKGTADIEVNKNVAQSGFYSSDGPRDDRMHAHIVGNCFLK